MIRNVFVLFLALLAFDALTVVPSFCISGLIEHACHCDYGCGDGSCTHESGCSQDPCASMRALREDASFAVAGEIAVAVEPLPNTEPVARLMLWEISPATLPLPAFRLPEAPLPLRV